MGQRIAGVVTKCCQRRRRRANAHPRADQAGEGTGLPHFRRPERGAAGRGHRRGRARRDPDAAPADGDRHHRSVRGRPLQGRQERPRGRRGREAGSEARYSRRPGADVSQADGPGAAADARAGGGDFQADRRSRDHGAAAHQPLRFHRPGASRSGAETDRRRRAFRPRDPRQEDREPRALHENAAAPLQAGGENWARQFASNIPRSCTARDGRMPRN